MSLYWAHRESSLTTHYHRHIPGSCSNILPFLWCIILQTCLGYLSPLRTFPNSAGPRKPSLATLASSILPTFELFWRSWSFPLNIDSLASLLQLCIFLSHIPMRFHCLREGTVPPISWQPSEWPARHFELWLLVLIREAILCSCRKVSEFEKNATSYILPDSHPKPSQTA